MSPCIQNECIISRAVPIISLLMFLLFIHIDSSAAKDYGYYLTSDSLSTIWWTEGSYKIMRNDPIPSESREEIFISCARNEYEPFQLVLFPKFRIDDVRIYVSSLRNASGEEIKTDNISILHVEYLNIKIPTDDFGGTGDWPDPLPPYTGSFTAFPGENHPLWITVYVPSGLKTGTYRGTIAVTSGFWKKEIPLQVEVWPFQLPEKTTIRSSFGLFNENLEAYHNLETPEELRKVSDLYMKNFKEHRVCPTSPLSLYPMKITTRGVYWEGGFFVTDSVQSGKRSLIVYDNSVSKNVEATYIEKIPVTPSTRYIVSWFSKTGIGDQEYTVMVSCYNAEDELFPAHNKLKIHKGSTVWKHEQDTLVFLPEVQKIKIHLFATFRDEIGSKTGEIYYDDVSLRRETNQENLLHGGDFEMNIEDMSVDVDFTEFDKGAQRYLNDFGFNSFNLELEGLGTGSFHSKTGGAFCGFTQSSPEYDKLMSEYFKQVQEHLEENGWLGKEYIYWFDEPGAKDYEFVREGMKTIRKAAPKLTRFITENAPGPEIMDVAEISCTALRKVNPEFIADQVAKGKEFWSYLSTGTRRSWVSLFTDHPAIDMRIWLWMSYKYKMKGILVWSANYWNSPVVFPPQIFQNPWKDPMSYRSGYDTPFGQVNNWGNGDGRFVYPPNRDPNHDKRKYIEGPINSIRWEIMREGIEDYEYFCLLRNLITKAGPDKKETAEKASQLLNFPESLFRSGQEYTKDPQALLNYRRKIAEMIRLLQ